MTPMMAAVTLLADEPTQTGPEFGKASPMGLLIVVVLFICTCALVWSMNRHLKRLPKSFDADPEPVAAAAEVEPSSDEPSG